MTSSENPPRPTVHIPHPVYLYVIFDGPAGPESGRFVEVEDENGQGVGGATWEERGDGLWSLGPFLQPPAEVAEQPASDLGAMVEEILAETDFSFDKDGVLARLARILDTAQRLKTALTQREEVLRAECEAVGLTGSMATLTNLLTHIRNNHAVTLGAQGSHIRRIAKRRDDAEAALAQREAVMGDMGDALKAEKEARLATGWQSTCDKQVHGDSHIQCGKCFICLERKALAKYRGEQ